MSHVIRKELITLEEYADFLRSWKGVKYSDCGMSKSGIDCLRFVILVGDWLHGWDTSKLPPIPKKPKQTAIHDARTAFKVVDFVHNRYSPTNIVWSRKDDPKDLDLQPGQCLLVRNQVNPGHGLVSGTRKNCCWHSINDPSLEHGGNVHETNLGWCLQTGLLQVIECEGSLLQC